MGQNVKFDSTDAIYGLPQEADSETGEYDARATDGTYGGDQWSGIDNPEVSAPGHSPDLDVELSRLLDQLSDRISTVPNFEANLGSSLPGQFDHFQATPWSDVAFARGGGGSGGGGGSATKGGGKGGGETLLTEYTSGNAAIADTDEFNIRIEFSGAWTAEQQAMVTRAADFLSQIIVGDLRDEQFDDGPFVDDVTISVSTGRIDGAGNPMLGNVLAQTQIEYVRDTGSVDEWLPLISSIKLDATDLKDSSYSSTWDSIILHEMVHALGFAGPIWQQLGLVDENGDFVGEAAMAAYGGAVPIEGDGGTGTAGSHWDEATFAPPGSPDGGNELMTGWIDPTQTTYLSDTTVGALSDMGYTVNDPSSGSSYLDLSILVG